MVVVGVAVGVGVEVVVGVGVEAVVVMVEVVVVVGVEVAVGEGWRVMGCCGRCGYPFGFCTCTQTTIAEAVAKREARIVAWLRERAEERRRTHGYGSTIVNVFADALDGAADAIERGEVK